MIELQFRYPLLDEPRPVGLYPWQLCPVCNERWQPPGRSRLQCHGKCLLTYESEDALMMSPLSSHDLAALYDLPTRVVMTAIARARRRGAPRIERKRTRTRMRVRRNEDLGVCQICESTYVFVIDEDPGVCGRCEGGGK